MVPLLLVRLEPTQVIQVWYRATHPVKVLPVLQPLKEGKALELEPGPLLLLPAFRPRRDQVRDTAHPEVQVRVQLCVLALRRTGRERCMVRVSGAGVPSCAWVRHARLMDAWGKIAWPRHRKRHAAAWVCMRERAGVM